MPVSFESGRTIIDPILAHEAVPRRIRHVTSLQVRNLTPFPVRDAFASALTQPSEQPQFNVHGHLSDDLDVTVGRRRGRRTSSGLKLDGEGVQNEADRLGEPTLGRRTSSKASINSSLSAVPSTPRIGRRPSVAGTPTVRPPLRQRTLSIASSHSLQAGSSSAISDISNSNALTFHGLLRDTSQSGLEKILQSRLVETFLTITLPTIPLLQSQSAPNGVHHDHTDHADDFIPSRVSTPTIKTSREKALSVSSPKPGSSSCSKTLPRRSTITAGSNNPSPSKATTPAKRNAPSTPSGLARSSLSGALPKSASVTSLPNGKTVRSPASPSPTPHKQRSPIPSSFSATQVSSPSISVQPSVSGQGASTPSSSTSGSHDEFPSTPDHISAIHWPSTNPSFQLDARNGFEFAPGADLSGSKMRVEVWGRSAWASTPGKRFDSGKGNVEIEKSNRSTDGVDAKGKGKEKQRDDENCQMAEWKMLEGWDVDLADLVLLPEDLACHPSHLPSNSLLITLSPPGRTFYLPLPSHFSRTSSRAHSPSSGYNSDPESEIRKARTSGEVAVPTPLMRQTPDRFSISPDAETSIELEEGRSSRRKRKAKTAGWQDLLKLINIQTCIIDTEQSLSDVIREIDKLVVRNETSVLTREVSEREAWVGQLRDDASKVANDSDVLRSRIKARREEIRARREMLALARESYERDLQEEEELEDELTAEREQLSSLRSSLPPIRSALLTTVSSIFPIELLSPPDLLFTILDVPLPIPMTATDPAPPLFLPSHKEVTEDAVATALGYAAQVVQLLSAYMGMRLVYPVTCVGSKSLIKDGISAMVGPRMFPLFSKGVDTYRFEYGVFLLNKDIELLMTDRNLRALDMRHTLPNLKNLLLTLTDSENIRSPPTHHVASSSASISSLRSPVLTQTPLPSETSTIQANSLPEIAVDTTAAENGSPSASGSSTPTATADSNTLSRKSRTFLDLTPLAGFLRSRYPSSAKPPAKGPVGIPETPPESASAGASTANASGDAADGDSHAADDAAGSGDDEDDRRTIRADDVADEEDDDDEVVQEDKIVTNGNGHTAPNLAEERAGGHEKVVEDGVPLSPTVLLSS